MGWVLCCGHGPLNLLQTEIRRGELSCKKPARSLEIETFISSSIFSSAKCVNYDYLTRCAGGIGQDNACVIAGNALGIQQVFNNC